mgnify:CR=1 FL=1
MTFIVKPKIVLYQHNFQQILNTLEEQIFPGV